MNANIRKSKMSKKSNTLRRRKPRDKKNTRRKGGGLVESKSSKTKMKGPRETIRKNEINKFNERQKMEPKNEITSYEKFLNWKKNEINKRKTDIIQDLLSMNIKTKKTRK